MGNLGVNMIVKYGCVKLRAIEDKDFDLLFYMINAPEIENNLVGWNFPVCIRAQKQWMEDFKNSLYSIKFMIELINSNTIGMVMLENIDWKNRTAEFGCKMSALPQDRIKGDMTDAVNGMLKYAFGELGMECVYGYILEDNALSRKLCKRAGFIEEGILRRRVYKSGRFHDLVSISILKDDFNKKELLQTSGR